jgi:hypothetical protein
LGRFLTLPWGVNAFNPAKIKQSIIVTAGNKLKKIEFRLRRKLELEEM